MDNKKIIKEYIDGSDWRIKENSNMAYSLQGLNNHIVSHAISDYWLNEIYPDKIGKAHINGDYHIHDLSSLSCYCGGWDLKDILIHGFNGVNEKVESTPPKHFRSALGQLVNFMYTLQGEMAGAQAVSSFDTLLAPYIRYDKLDYKEVKQAIQEFVFNMNVPTRVGFQSVFSNITMDITPDDETGNENVVIAGEIKRDKYKDFDVEREMINLAFCEVMMEGDAKGRIFTFPIPTYNITKDFEWDSPVANKLFEMTGKYGIPYFSNFINSDMNPSDVRSMCPLGPNEEILIESSRGWGAEKITLKDAYHNSKKKKTSLYQVFTGKDFEDCFVDKYDNQEMIEVELVNGHKITMTKTHANIVMDNINKQEIRELAGGELTTSNYLPYSTDVYEGECGGSYELGYLVGCFAGDGSLDGDTAVIFSLSVGKKEATADLITEISENLFGARWEQRRDGKSISLRVKSKALNGLCRDYVSGIGRNKKYNANIYKRSESFRRGIIQGHYETDGGNRKRIYTSSKEMVKSLNLLAATLGTTTNVSIDKRGISEGSYSDNDMYVVRIYSLNNDSRGDDWYKYGGYVWFKIKSIKDAPGSTGYCLQVGTNDELFSVANTGIITHNCRLRIDNRTLKKRGGGLFGANPLTGSVGIVTINLPRIGYLSKDKDEFFSRISELMDLAKESLIIKRALLEEKTENGLYPYAAHYLKLVHERFGEYWKNHFSTIGLIGMNEAIINLNDDNITTETGKALAEETLVYMRDKLIAYQEETGDVWNLEATPAEGTTRRLAAADKKRYQEIIVANEDAYMYEEATPYYTNSTHLPVGYTSDAFESLDHQDSLQSLYTGGTVSHLYIGESISDYRSVQKLVKTIAEKYKLPYFTITPTFSICPVHGFLSGEHEYCPKCDAALKVKINEES